MFLLQLLLHSRILYNHIQFYPFMWVYRQQRLLCVTGKIFVLFEKVWEVRVQSVTMCERCEYSQSPSVRGESTVCHQVWEVRVQSVTKCERWEYSQSPSVRGESTVSHQVWEVGVQSVTKCERCEYSQSPFMLLLLFYLTAIPVIKETHCCREWKWGNFQFVSLLLR